MRENDKLKEIFSRLARAHHECGERYVDHELDAFAKQLTEDEFFTLSPERQLSHLRWYDEAFLGRGERLRGLVDRNLVPKEFAVEMKTAILEYLLTTELAFEIKKAMRACLEDLGS